ncbi:hypothetical protein BMS3Abin17_00713 [archaeon BMS3Abin17]|nr:hypothetical protein BMS3Abin17_00713 [archaeon BMS3Abin17]HDZ61034.1 hypothetical protein [Candidatus Pacearchaeota archaeon]
MKFNFRKISAVLTSGLLAISSVGFAAAANYPSPFVVGGTADVAIVYGTGEGVSSLDIIQAGNIQSNLQSKMGSSAGTSGGTVTGEAAELFSSGTKLYINDSLNSVKTVLTKTELPTVLADESFSGNVDAKVTQTIKIGSNPSVKFKKQPTSSDDPDYGLTTSITQTNYIYNATATFNKAVNFSHADSEGNTLDLFGQTFTVGSATTTDDLVLLKSAEKISLTSDNPTVDVTIAGEAYTVELVSSSDTSATIQVTDSAGTSESKEINEAASKKVNGITIAVTNADETNLKLSASIVAGADKVTLTDGSSVTYGSDDTIVDGTLVDFGSTTGITDDMTSLTISVYASDSDKDAIKPGESLKDPVFGSFKLDFAGLNIADDSTARGTILVAPNSDDKMDVTFTDHRGNEKTITWAKNTTTAGMQLMRDDEGRNISVFEKEALVYKDYVVVGNEDEGYLLKLSAVKNQSGTDYSKDYVKFTDVFTGDTLTTAIDVEGSGTLYVGGNPYTVTYSGDSSGAAEDYTVRINSPDSSGNGVAIIYPTIQTEKGAKVGFYEPETINLTSWDGSGANLTTLKIPDGDGYTDVAITVGANNLSEIWTIGGNALNTSLIQEATEPIGQLNYAFNTTGVRDQVTLYLRTVANTSNIIRPAIVIFEEKDDNNEYQALIVELEDGATGDDGIGIDSVEDTWSGALSTWSASMASDSKKTKRGDLWGTITTIDSSDSDQKSATISYPDEQVYAQLYIAEEAASITAGATTSGTSTPLGEVLVKDSEVSSVATKNLIIIGGSCINSAAASVLGEGCGSAFTDATGVGSGEFLIKGVSDSTVTSKLALVVAGYESADTVNAAKYLQTQVVDTDKAYKGTTSTTATEIVEATA